MLSRSVVSSCLGGTVMIVDPSQTVLTRLWCIYQVWMGAYYGDSNKLKIAFPGEAYLHLNQAGH